MPWDVRGLYALLLGYPTFYIYSLLSMRGHLLSIINVILPAQSLWSYVSSFLSNGTLYTSRCMAPTSSSAGEKEIFGSGKDHEGIVGRS